MTIVAEQIVVMQEFSQDQSKVKAYDWDRKMSDVLQLDRSVRAIL